MEAIQRWIVSVSAMALLTGLCRSLMLPGPARRVGGMVCALLLFTVLVAPVRQIRLERLGEELERRETMVRAVGDWCVSVFGAEGVTLPTGETSSASPSEESDSAERSAGAEEGS